MRLTLIPALVAGATLVAATPIRVEVVTFEQISPVPARFGHAVHHANNEHVATLIKTGGPIEKWQKKPCGGMGRSRFREKALELSNAFRKALGLPSIEMNHPHQHKKIQEPEMRILPFIGTPQAMVESMPAGGEVDQETPYFPHPRPHGHHDQPPKDHHHEHHHDHHHRPHPHGAFRFLNRAPFGERLLVAISVLGKWEGRAVAFVFGAGLGVLLRMFYVLAVVAYRTARRSGREEEEHYVLFVEEVEEDHHQPTPVAVAPPSYTDEKAPIAPASN